jgi:NADH-quinone oxidoreductase subunit N
MSIGTKVAAFAALLRFAQEAVPALREYWSPLLWALAVVTMLVGNIAAVTQTNIKRMLAYSSIGQAGYVLTAVVATDSNLTDVRSEALQSVLFYLLAYTLMNLGAFAVVLALTSPAGEQLDLATDYVGLAARHPWLAGCLSLFMLSLGGVPPMAGFLAKFAVFRAAVDAGYWPLVLIGVITSMIALAFYLRVIVLMYRPGSATPPAAHQPVAFPLIAVLTICVIGTVLLGILPGGALHWIQDSLFIMAR